MAASAEESLDELQAIAALLVDQGAATVDASLLERAERAIAFAVAWLAPTRADAAPAVEAAIAGAAPRPNATSAADLALTVDLFIAALSARG